MKKGRCSQKEIAVHTHDLISYRRCRRKWGLSSAFKRHLQPKPSVHGVNKNLWFGSMFHFALEDKYGWNKFGSAPKAFEALATSFPPEEVPLEFETLLPLGISMLEYFELWAEDRGDFETLWCADGEYYRKKDIPADAKVIRPLVEEKFSLVLEDLCHYKFPSGHCYFKTEGDSGLWRSPDTGETFTADEAIASGAEYVEIVYHGTFDRIVIDDDDFWWVLDYKTAAAIDTKKLCTDFQISAYSWAAAQWYDHEFEGMVYLQCSKNPPHPPAILKSGVSAAKSQRTTHKLYRQALIDYYGTVEDAPAKNIQLLNDLAYQEDMNGDSFIRYDKVPRNEFQQRAFYYQIVEQGKEILNPKLALYPNPTKDCSWECPFRDVCCAMDEGANWESYLEDFEVRNETMNDEVPKWERRFHLKYPELYTEEIKRYKIAEPSVDDFLSREI